MHNYFWFSYSSCPEAFSIYRIDPGFSSDSALPWIVQILNTFVWNLKKGGAIMAEKGFKRKLTAILSADVEGYSRLMDDDDE